MRDSNCRPLASLVQQIYQLTRFMIKFILNNLEAHWCFSDSSSEQKHAVKLEKSD